jgi:mannose-6-phosphate isomerase-like protein (cupin superfamily)
VRVRPLAFAQPFTTKDGSTIRELHHTEQQSLAEASLEPGRATERHYHSRTEEIYFVLEGEGEMEVDGERRGVAPGDAVLIPAGARHQVRADAPLRFLCCCAPPYSHEDTFFDQ